MNFTARVGRFVEHLTCQEKVIEVANFKSAELTSQSKKLHGAYSMSFTPYMKKKVFPQTWQGS